MCVHVCMYICMFACMHAFTQVCVCVCAWVCVCIYIYLQIWPITWTSILSPSDFYCNLYPAASLYTYTDSWHIGDMTHTTFTDFYSWGWNSFGQLGDSNGGEGTDILAPIMLTLPSTVPGFPVVFSCGYTHNIVVLQTGDLTCELSWVFSVCVCVCVCVCVSSHRCTTKCIYLYVYQFPTIYIRTYILGFLVYMYIYQFPTYYK